MSDTPHPRNPHYETYVRDSFARQIIMQTLGASLAEVAPGEVTIMLPFREDLCQQHGYLHAGVVTTIVDSACGYAALSLLPEGMEVLSVEFKINFLSPAKGTSFIAKGRVLKSGRTISVCTGDVFALDSAYGEEKLVATMLTTVIAR